MEDVQLKELLDSYNNKLEEARVLNLQSWVLNFKCYENIQSQKVRSKLRSLITIKTIAILLGIIWVIFLGYLVFHSFQMKNIFFIISLSAIILFTVLAIFVYIWHIVLISKINDSENVIKTQEKITRLQLSTINVTRILFLQAPFYCTFWWSQTMIANGPGSFWLISFPIALLFTFGALWLFKNISTRNVDKKWFKFLFNSPEWTSLIKAKDYLEEINLFKNSNS